MSCWSDKFSTCPILTIFSKRRYLTNLSKVTSRCELSNIWATFWGGIFLNFKKNLVKSRLGNRLQNYFFLRKRNFCFFLFVATETLKRVRSNYFLTTEKSLVLVMSLGENGFKFKFHPIKKHNFEFWIIFLREKYTFKLGSSSLWVKTLKSQSTTHYTQYGPIKSGRIKNQGSDFEKK